MACVYIYLAFYFILGMFSFLYVTLAHLSLRLVFMVFSGCLLLVYRKQASVVTVFVFCGFAPVAGCFCFFFCEHLGVLCIHHPVISLHYYLRRLLRCSVEAQTAGQRRGLPECLLHSMRTRGQAPSTHHKTVLFEVVYIVQFT